MAVAIVNDATTAAVANYTPVPVVAAAAAAAAAAAHAWPRPAHPTPRVFQLTF